MEVSDYALSRFGCYLSAMNGDPRKPEIAQAQGYFAVQTRRMEQWDELLKYHLSLSRALGMVYALAVKQLINRLYRDHDYVRRRKLEGRRTAYDTAVERDSQALAWLVAAAALYVPEEVKHHPIPPRPPKPVRRTPRSDRAAKVRARTKALEQEATPCTSTRRSGRAGRAGRSVDGSGRRGRKRQHAARS